jgi:hypothetical protein
VGEDWIDRLAVGAKYTGVGLVGLFVYRLFVFTCNFLAGRYDARQARLEAREERVDQSIGNRLTHLEEQQKEDQGRIRLLEEGVGILTAELRQLDPGNPKLREVANMLRHATPVVPPDQVLDNLIHRAGQAIDKEDGA